MSKTFSKGLGSITITEQTREEPISIWVPPGDWLINATCVGQGVRVSMNIQGYTEKSEIPHVEEDFDLYSIYAGWVDPPKEVEENEDKPAWPLSITTPLTIVRPTRLGLGLEGPSAFYFNLNLCATQIGGVRGTYYGQSNQS